MVYSGGLRRCLIIFAPHTLILDRRTWTCRTPSLLSLLQRSKNFTSGVAIGFTLSIPIICGRKLPLLTVHVLTVSVPTAPQHSQGTAPHYPEQAPRPAQLCCHIRSMLCHSMDEHPAKTGRLEHTELSRVTLMVDSGGGQGLLAGNSHP